MTEDRPEFIGVVARIEPGKIEWLDERTIALPMRLVIEDMCEELDGARRATEDEMLKTMLIFTRKFGDFIENPDTTRIPVDDGGDGVDV